MHFNDFKFVYVKADYLQLLHSEDSEVFYSPNSNYDLKPHLGILVNINSFKYVIPLTSAKEKHRYWRDVTQTNYRIYEIIDVRTAPTDSNDIIVPFSDYNYLRNRSIPSSDFEYYKKRILSVLEIKKMIPVIDSALTIIDLNKPGINISEEQRRLLMQKEYFFCVKIKEDIETKAQKIYEQQINTGIINPYHCDYKKLERVATTYT